MPLRPLHHTVLIGQLQTPSSPLRSTFHEHHRLFPDPDYFDSIDLLRNWADANEENGLLGGLKPSYAKAQTGGLESRPTFTGKSKFLVCHDFKGGYTENPFERGYAFEFWHLVDTFIYFSHNRITVPPRGWVDAGLRHGSKVLGTVFASGLSSRIFEWAESKPELQKCLYDGIFHGSELTTPEAGSSTLSFSTTYASHLITLAQVRNFGGYLVNIETDLNFLPPASSYPGKSQKERDEDAASLEKERNLAGLKALISPDIQRRREQRMEKNATALLGWVGWLREEGKKRVGPHWEIIWYDSVTTAGQLQWQDALTPVNEPFFTNSDAIFTNYTWARPPDPAPPGALQELSPLQFQHHPALLSSARLAESLNRPCGDVYFGIDVFGRGCYGGFDVGRSLDMIFPSRGLKHAKASSPSDFEPGKIDNHRDLGLSVALFAPGWTWEREKEGGEERSWSEWWDDELRFWIGKAAAGKPPPEPDGEVAAHVGGFFGPRERSFHCISPILPTSQPGPVIRPTKSSELQPNSLALSSPLADQGSISPSPFYTNFNRGSGKSWWVRGCKVYDASLPAKDPAEKRGWTDIGSCFPKPDRIWPCPVVFHFADGDEVGSADTLISSSRNMGEGWAAVKASLTDYEVWEGGTSLEIVLCPWPDEGNDPGSPAGPSVTVLPLCTLNAHHFASHRSRFYSLELVIKPLSLPAEVKNLRQLQLRACLLWTSSESGEGCSYRLSQSQSSQTEMRELVNGWYRITAIVQPNETAAQLLAQMQATEMVSVIALGLGFPQSRPLHTGGVSPNIRLLVGEISFSALLQSTTTLQNPLVSVGNPPSHGADSKSRNRLPSSTAESLYWKPVPRPGGASSTSLWGILTWQSEKNGDGKDDNDPIGGCSADIISGYFNVFASLNKPSWEDLDHDANQPNWHVWLGTSTYESDPDSFVVAGLEPSDLIPSTYLQNEVLDLRDAPTLDRADVITECDKLASRPATRVTFGVERVGSLAKMANGDGEGKKYICEVEVNWDI